MARSITDLRKLRHVVGVAELGSFTAASRALAITQSALTKSVADVEATLGMKLFERLPRGIALTEAGEAFVPRAERLLADSEELMRDVGDLQSLAAGQLRLGVAPAAFAGFLEHTVSAFARVYPGVRITVAEGQLEDMAQAALNGTVDVLVGATNYLSRWTELQTLAAAELRIYMIARREHPLAARSANVKASDLLGYPIILPASGLLTDAELAQAYTRAGLTPQPPHYVCDDFPLVRQLVRATDALSPVVSLPAARERFRKEFVVLEDILEFEPYSVGLAWRRTRASSPAVAAFADVFRKFLSDAR